MRHILYSVAICLTLSLQAFAEDEAKDQIFVIDNFSKGLNEKTSQYLLPKDQATVCENVRFASELGSISKRDNLNVYGTADATSPILGMHRFYKKDGTKVLIVNAGNKIYTGADSTGVFTAILTVTTGNHRWQWTTWHDIAIGCDGYNNPVKYDGTSASATYLGSCLATDAGSGAGPNGTYLYKVSFYTASYEVLFNTPSNSITVTDNDITLTMIPQGPDTYGGEDVIGRKIYRTKTGGSSYFLVPTTGTIANNTAVTINDSEADAALADAMPAGDATYKPPTGKFVIMHDGRLWFANDPSNNPSRAWYGEINQHDVFKDDSYWDVRQNDGDSITFIKQVLNLLTIGKDNSIQKLYTDGETTEWILSDPFTFIGCQAPYTVDNSSSGLIYLGRDGLYTFNGQYSQLISDVVTPEIKNINSTDLENCWGIYHNNMYYMAYSSVDPASAYNNRVLVYDVISDAYSIDLLSINCFCAFNSGDDWGILYAGGSDVGKVYSYSLEDNQITHRRHSDFTGIWDDMRYIPESVGGDPNSPILEIARTETMAELPAASISTLQGIIAREDTQGQYVSQVMKINANTLDKLYWNESIPVTGGDVTIKLRTSATGEQNLILNDDFEFWDNYPIHQSPNDWVEASTSTTVQACTSTTLKYLNTYGVRVATEATISQVLLNSANYAGKNLVFKGWVASSNTTADKIYLEIDDEYSTARAYYTNSGAFQATYATLAVNASATKVTLKCAVLNGSTAPATFDTVMCIEGTTCTHDWSAWSTAYSDPSGSDISAITPTGYLQYLITMTATDITYSPTMDKLNNYVVKINYEKEGTIQTTNIPLQWESGWLDFGKSMYEKVLRRIYVYHEGTAGTLNVEVDNLEGDSDTFAIDLTTYPTMYTERFTNGALRGEYFKVKITNNDANALKIRKIIFIYDLQRKIYR